MSTHALEAPPALPAPEPANRTPADRGAGTSATAASTTLSVTSAHPVLRVLVRAGVATALVAAIVALVFPRVTGAEWSGVVEQLTTLSAAQLVAPSLVWVASVYVWAVASAAVLPGLTVAQGVAISLAGSAVSNVAPLGPALGVGASWAMARSWGFGAGAFTLFTLLTGLANLVVRLVLPVLALVLLGPLAGGQLQAAATGAALLLAVLALERVLSSVPLTPSGVGITETGCVALLVALSTPAGPAAAGVLLFRGFTYLAEVPAGALAAAVWAGRRSWRAGPTPA